MELSENEDSFFISGLNSWKELNCTRDFVDFLKEIDGKTKSFHMILYHKDAIAQALLASMNSTLAYEPIIK